MVVKERKQENAEEMRYAIYTGKCGYSAIRYYNSVPRKSRSLKPGFIANVHVVYFNKAKI